MIVEDLVGLYQVSGHNQDAAQSVYNGLLQLSIDDDNRVVALWNIGNDQVQQGTGFFKDGILVINFNYKGAHDVVYKGVVVYKCVTCDVLDGFWSEKHGDPQFLGVEQAVRVGNAFAKA